MLGTSTKMEIEQVLLQSGLIDDDQRRLAAEQANGRRIDHVLVEMGVLTEEQALQAFAKELVCGVETHRTEIDALIARHARNGGDGR